MDNELAINSWSSGSSKIFGYETEEVMGKQLKNWLEKELNNVFAEDASKRFGGWVVKYQFLNGFVIPFLRIKDFKKNFDSKVNETNQEHELRKKQILALRLPDYRESQYLKKNFFRLLNSYDTHCFYKSTGISRFF